MNVPSNVVCEGGKVARDHEVRLKIFGKNRCRVSFVETFAVENSVT